VIATLLALLLLTGASLALGEALRRALPPPSGPGENALAFTGGLGAAALLLALLALAGRFAWALPVVAALACAGGALAFTRFRGARAPDLGSPAGLAAGFLVAVTVLSAVAPVTDDDSLAYPLPLARRIAASGAWRFWPDLWLGVFPLSQEMLLAFALRVGADRLGAISAAELVLCAVLLRSLARRADLDGFARGAALFVGLACPVVGFLAPSAKEDLLVCVMTLAACHALLSLEEKGAAPWAGVFAGFAASAKYTGLPVAAGVLLAVLLFSPQRRVRAVFLAASGAVLAGALFYAVNAARVGNPIPPYLSPPFASFLSPLSKERALETFRWGLGKGPVDFFLAPLRMVRTPAAFGTMAGVFNPLSWIGLLTLGVEGDRRRFAPLLLVAGVSYTAWFLTNQVARLLLPAALCLAVPGAAILGRVASPRFRFRPSVATALALSAASLLLVAGARLVDYAWDPVGFFGRRTPAVSELTWMNAHLDATTSRVGTPLKTMDPLRIPWIDLDPAYQCEIPAELLDKGAPLLAALRARGVTHLFVATGSMPSLEALLTPVRANPDTLIGGVHLFREGPRVATTVYALPRDNAGGERPR
jgi:hypothetical protein